jgi:hypothetical protein
VSEVNTSETGTTSWSQAVTFALRQITRYHPFDTEDYTVSAPPSTPRRSRAVLQDGVPYEKRWLALAVIALTVLLVILDATVVNIALPAVSKDLGITPATQQWIVTAYTLTFGGFLLLGGRIADFWGRKRTYLVGAAGFAVASALGGLAQNEAMLFGARALQGAFGALLAPASLALLTVLFTDTKERAKAFAVYGAIAGGPAARRSTHRVRRLAVVLLGQPAGRHRGDRAGDPDRPGEQGAR